MSENLRRNGRHSALRQYYFFVLRVHLALAIFAMLTLMPSAAMAEEPANDDRAHADIEGEADEEPDVEGEASSAGHEPPRDLKPIVIRGRSEKLVGDAPAASMGRVGAAEIERRAFLRAGEVLEVVPGLIATQHSGTGKANQFFLRGFNLDHGTDFSTSIEGVPMNLPTHGHGHGYLDLNLLIPELIDVVEFRKGPYYADVGDFSSAGTSAITYKRRLETTFFIKAGFGEYGFWRDIVAASPRVAGGDLLLAGEFQAYEGPWSDVDENLGKWNGIAKWTRDLGEDAGVEFFASAYHADWNSADQVPLRAVTSGMIDRYGSLDDDLGGRTGRYTASVSAWRGGENGTRAQAWMARYDFDLWSNFTYFLDDPTNGDEFQQIDERTMYGADLAQDLVARLGPVYVLNTLGLQTRHDHIGDVGLLRTAGRDTLDTVRRDDVRVTSLGIWWQAEAQLADWLRGFVGLRGDFYWFDVDAHGFPENSGNEDDAIASPKVGLVFGPWLDTELYVSYGRGFHSNDARGTTITVDPGSVDPVDAVDPLVASEGTEAGIRTEWIDGLRSSVAVWLLDLDSELLFVGDAGTTEATRPSRRWGVELANFWQPLDWLMLDCDVTATESEFRDDDPAGDHIPGAIATTVAAGAAVDFDWGLFASLRLRHFGRRPLIEDNSVKSRDTTLVNLQTGWRWRDTPFGDLTLTVDVTNLLDASDDDITYYYPSRLPGEGPDGVQDVHFHPVEPRTVRGDITWAF